jgi:putative component of membrane protein insertase Oxa1/YidC/SpoIIIJ protein YidD
MLDMNEDNYTYITGQIFTPTCNKYIYFQSLVNRFERIIGRIVGFRLVEHCARFGKR